MKLEDEPTPVAHIRMLIALTLILLAAATGALGVLSPHAMRFFSLSFLGGICLLCLAPQRSVWKTLLLLVVGTALAYQTTDTAIWLFAWVACLAWVEAGSREESEPTLGVLVNGAFLVALLYALYRHVPDAWRLAHTSSVEISRGLSGLSGVPAELGVEPSGLWIMLALASIALAYLRQASGVAGYLAGSLCVLAAITIYLGYQAIGVLYAPLLASDVAIWLSGGALSATARLDPALLFLHGPLVLLVIAVLLSIWLLPSIDVRGRRRRPRGGAIWQALALALGVSLGFLLAHHPTSPAAGGKVLFYNQGMLNWKVPVIGRYGIQQAGMFGLLPRYLQAAGYEIQRVRPDAKDPLSALEDASVLVVINPTEKIPAAQLRSIWKFVERGGGLLVLGDHTDIAGTLAPLNDLLAPVAIRFAFDSAFAVRHWEGDFDFSPHPITRRLNWSNGRLQHSTGASLRVGDQARPIVTGKFVFSDAGVRENDANGFLGDYRHQPSEQLGGLPVVAESRWGRGRVVVFGDTSAFQNPAVAHSAPFLLDVFAYLAAAADVPSWSRRDLMLLGLSALLAGLLFLLASARFVAMASSSIVVAAFLVGATLDGQVRLPFVHPRVALIDAAHMNRFSLRHWEKDSLGGLATNLSRSGYLPLVIHEDEWDRLPPAKLLFSVAPARSFNEADLIRLDEFMRGGGFVVLGVGAEERIGSLPLLERYGLTVEFVPLGPVPIVGKTSDPQEIRRMQEAPHFLEAWPIAAEPPLDETMYATADHTIVGMRKVGRGGLVVIADSKFLLDRTLEEENAWWLGNIYFLRNLLLNLEREGAN